MKIEKGDFIEIDFIGRLKEGGRIFDLTDEEVAKKEKLYSKDVNYGPIVICVGEKNLVAWLDEALIGKEIGKEYKIEVEAEKGFGKKDPKLVRVVPINVFRKEKIRPFTGLRVNIDGFLGTIRSVSGGRVVVDFNHPLAGKSLIYEIKINRKISDDKEKLDSLVKLYLSSKDFLTEIKENKAVIKLKRDLNEKIKEKFIEKVKELVPDVKEVSVETMKQKATIQE